MPFAPWLIVLSLTGQSSPVAFELLDVETIQNRPVNRYRPLELIDTPVRPVNWEVAPPAGVRYGLLTIGSSADSAPAVAWDATTSTLWLDADGDRRLTQSERVEVKPGPPAAIPVKIAAKEPIRRTILVRPGLLGAGPRFTVRGAMSGELRFRDKPVRTILIDGDVDGRFDSAGTDRVWVDLDDDGRFDTVTEQFPLGAPIRTSGTSFTVSSDAWARSVAAHERDPRIGRLQLRLGDGPLLGKVIDLSANLVSKTGELVTITSIDTTTNAPVGKYRVTALSLQIADSSDRVWSYTFSGGTAGSIEVAPNAETRVNLLDRLAMEVTATARGDSRPGDDVSATPSLRCASGLYLSNCTVKRADTALEQERSAAIVLQSPDGTQLDQAVSGFA